MNVTATAQGDGVCAARVDAQSLDWEQITDDLNSHGSALVEGLLSTTECAAVRGLYELDPRFRKTVVMARHGFGRGEYRYFKYPLPATVGHLRESFYPFLAAIANQWSSALGLDVEYPSRFADYLKRCHTAGQTRPTPLLLCYGADDFNCLHQDLYGDVVFPLQVAIQLSAPGRDFDGGEFVLTEQRPRMQSRVQVVPAKQGDAVIFPVQHRPVVGKRGHYRVNVRHGVSRVARGKRLCLGIIFHDAA